MYEGISISKANHITCTINPINPLINYSALCIPVDVVVGEISVLAEFMCTDDFQLDIFPNVDLTELLKKREQAILDKLHIRSNCHAFTLLNSNSLWLCSSYEITEILTKCCRRIENGQQQTGDILVFYRTDENQNVSYTHSALFIDPNNLTDKPGVFPIRNISLDELLDQYRGDEMFYYSFGCRPNRDNI
ncbi:MAG TPA: hypothetical protein PKL85_03125 [Bacteroidia bacterium]|nr:hypothetical protein [Bacteroidia bacterium]